jgi:EAL domain-containing protein (putative c-di-GMP-specific phosphodiesterase class I)
MSERSGPGAGPPAPAEADYQRLRGEWLRFKTRVFDLNTELPTLVAVIDDVRRLLEERSAIGVVFLDLGAEEEIERLRGWQSFDEALHAFSRALRALRDEGVLDRRDVIAAAGVRSDKFLLFVQGEGGTAMKPEALEARTRALVERISAILPRFLPPAMPGPVTFDPGHAVMYRDPLLRPERAIQRALDCAVLMGARQRTREDDQRVRELEHILSEAQVVTLFQPILDLRSFEVLGHEIFTHGPTGGFFEEAERLFLLAERTARVVELERLCRSRALGSVRAHLSGGEKLFLNTSAASLQDPDVAGDGFVKQVELQGLRHGDVVLEITERVALEERSVYRKVLHNLKQAGFGIAIDDVGAGHSSLKGLVDVEPDYLKFDVSLVRDIDQNPIKRSLLETVVDLAARIGARVIAEGIEAESEMATVRDMGVPLGQGRYLCPPQLVPSVPAVGG